MPKWLDEKGAESDVAVSARARLARNFAGMPFPARLDEASAAALLDKAHAALPEMRCAKMADLPDLEREALTERRLISIALAHNVRHGALLFADDESRSVLVNEEDHLRIQCLLPGLATEEALRGALETNERIEKENAFAFDEKLGYLTCCPTNVGTGLRCSVMLHLPALAMTGQLMPMIQAAGKMGLAVRGVYGEGSDAQGAMLQISNRMTLGASEEEITRGLTGVVRQIIARERGVRTLLRTVRRTEIEDRVWRAYALLSSARRMDTKEFMHLYSDMRLGVQMELLPRPKDEGSFARLLVDAQDASLQKRFGTQAEEAERDVLRARLIRETLA